MCGCLTLEEQTLAQKGYLSSFPNPIVAGNSGVGRLKKPDGLDPIYSNSEEIRFNGHWECSLI